MRHAPRAAHCTQHAAVCLYHVPLCAAQAIKADNPSLVNIALKSGNLATANVPFGDADGGEPPLMTAVVLGKHKVVKALIKGRAATDVPHSTTGYSLMHQAAALGHARVLQILMTSGMDPRERHHDGLTVLHRAVLAGNTDAVKSILNAEVTPEETTDDGRTSFDLADDVQAPIAVREVLAKFSRSPPKTEL